MHIQNSLPEKCPIPIMYLQCLWLFGSFMRILRHNFTFLLLKPIHWFSRNEAKHPYSIFSPYWSFHGTQRNVFVSCLVDVANTLTFIWREELCHLKYCKITCLILHIWNNWFSLPFLASNKARANYYALLIVLLSK